MFNQAKLQSHLSPSHVLPQVSPPQDGAESLFPLFVSS